MSFPLVVWERALAPRGNSFANTNLQRRRATTSYTTKKKKNHKGPPVHLRPGIHICMATTDPCLPIIAWKSNDAYCSWSSQLVPSNPIRQYFFFIRKTLTVLFCLKKRTLGQRHLAGRGRGSNGGRTLVYRGKHYVQDSGIQELSKWNIFLNYVYFTLVWSDPFLPIYCAQFT